MLHYIEVYYFRYNLNTYIIMYDIILLHYIMFIFYKFICIYIKAYENTKQYKNLENS